jgi:uncharacterized protein YbjT (DUF2867 family)
MQPTEKPLILVTGATGYIGGRLVPRLLEAGYRVRLFVRDPQRLQGRPWLDRVEVFTGDVLVEDTLAPAMQGVRAAYYMIHSMSNTSNFHERDVQAARNFGAAAKAANVEQIIYLGGLGDSDQELSEHLHSRHVTGEELRRSGVPVTEFRAAVIVGSGSVSYEMLRYLTERVPIMICPRWVYTRIQPIAIRDVLQYLVAALDNLEARGQIIEIGSQDTLTYREMILGYAQVRGLKRYLIPVPLLTPYLSSYWVHWVTPIPASIARPLIEGLRYEVVADDARARRLFPGIQPMGYLEAVGRALERLDAGEVETSWSDSLFSSQQDSKPVVLKTLDGMIVENRQVEVEAAPFQVFQTFTSIGGKKGYGYMDWAWRLRGVLDRMVGGVGFRRGRRSESRVRVGDAIDFWRVEAVEKGEMIRLRAEMRVPGRAWLQYRAQRQPDGKTRLFQTAYFAPKGLFGLLYWYALYPIHSLIFSGMIRHLAVEAEKLPAGKQPSANTLPGQPAD